MKKFFGFSLIELLISLIVISCITAAFTPLITKKFSSGVFGGGDSVSSITTECTEKFSDKCTLCTNNYCIDCSALSCGEDEYRDNKTCSCKKCTEKYGECTKCNAAQCLTCSDGQFLDEYNNCKPCTDKFDNCASCTLEKCLTCNKGYLMNAPYLTNACKLFECPSEDFVQIGNLCVTAKNMGDADNLTIVDTVSVVNSGIQCDAINGKCCWKVNTSGSGCNATNGDYSGCNRTLCNWSAADEICRNYNYAGLNWRLATTSEMSNWQDYSEAYKDDGLQFCKQASILPGFFLGTVSPYISNCDAVSKCTGAESNNCIPYSVWSSEKKDDSYMYTLSSTVFYRWIKTSYKNNSTSSVRCVTEFPSSCKDKFGQHCVITSSLYNGRTVAML